MPLTALLPILLAVASAEEEPITVRAYPWAPFISPMGEPFRGGPATGQPPIARWFGQADRNQDGILTAEEMQADADRFFTRLDGNRDGQIDPAELKTYEWEIAPDIQVNSNWKQPRGAAAAKPEQGRDQSDGDSSWKRKTDRHDGYRADGLQGAARYGLLNIPQPVAGADADFNRVVTLVEFRQAAAHRFKLLDENAQGRITLPELETRLPTRPKGKPARRRKDAPDTRIGLPLPEAD